VDPFGTGGRVVSTGAARVADVLGRFPAYLGLARPDTLATWVVTGLSGDLDVETAQLLGIRQAHRIGQAATETDLFLLASLHGLGPERAEPLRIRLEAVTALAGQLAAGTIDAATAAQLVTSLLQVRASAQPALGQLGAALAPLLAYNAQVGYFRACLRTVIGLHRGGNGTVSALLGAAAAYLGLAPSPAVDSADGFQHVASCTDLLTLAAPTGGGTITSDPDVLALEENPPRPAEMAPTARASGDRFQLLRVGFGTVPVTIRVLGLGGGTVDPMVVNVDAGYGFGYLGTVPGGSELQFTSDGQVTLDGADVGPLGFSFSGAVFASGGELRPGDFVFADSSRPPGPADASFAVTAPTTDAFDPAPAFPHPELALAPATALSGESRWAFFESVGHFGSLVGNQAVPTSPGPTGGYLDGGPPGSRSAVFASTGTPPAAAQVGFQWLERELYAVRLWIPARFAALDQPGATPVSERVRQLLDRHRAAGVYVYTEYGTPEWVLGTGVLSPATGTADPMAQLTGTVLWPVGTPQPSLARVL
jgi:hypothetical protein